MRQLITTLLILTLCHTAFAKSPVWKISDGEDYLYLGGTIHLLSKSDYPLPEAFDQAYADADEVWFETDTEQLTSPETQVALLDVMMFQDQRSLSTVLNRDTYNALGEFMQARGLSIGVFDKFTPAGLLFTLTAIELQRLGLIDETAGVDLYFDQRSAKDGKTQGHLESVVEQIGFMRGFNDLEPNALIKSTMTEISRTSEAWETILSAWRSGDTPKLATEGIEPMRSEFPHIYQTLLRQRNLNWLNDLKKMLKTDDIEFVLVGALHMAGEEGLLQLLTQAGYTVEQLD